MAIALNGLTQNATIQASGSFSATITTSTLDAGSYSVLYNFAATTDFTAASGSAKLTVQKAGTKSAVTANYDPSVFGQAVTFTATVTPASGTFDNRGAVQFAVNGINYGAPANLSGGIATIQDSALHPGDYTITATYSGNANFNGGNGTLSGGQTVKRATPTITWPTPAAITYGTPLSSSQLDATASALAGGQAITVPGTFRYTPQTGAMLFAGKQTLSVTFFPTDMADYNTATQTSTIQVRPATPTIQWPTPADCPRNRAGGHAVGR